METQQFDNSHGQRNTVHNVAKIAVRLALGEENDYIQRLLVNKLEGREKKYKATPVTELLLKPDRTILKRNLTQAVNITQQKAIDVLCEPSGEYGESAISQHKLCLKQSISPQNTRTDIQQSPTTAQNPHVIVDIGSFIANSNNLTIPLKTEPTEINAPSDDTQPVIDLSNNQTVSSWVINTLLQEKLNYYKRKRKNGKISMVC
jgi:hypothetical protein